MSRDLFGSAVSTALLTGLFLMVAASFPAQGQEGLVGHWKFDEGEGSQAEDASPSGGTARLIHAPQWVDGVDGSALSFAGEEDYAEVRHSAPLDLGSEDGSYTVSFWFRASGLPSDPPDAHFLTKQGFPYCFSFVHVPDGVIQFRTYDGTTCTAIDSGVDISDGDWHYVVGARDGKNKRLFLYIDGSLASSTRDGAKSSMRNSGPLRIGRSHGSDFSGAIDDLRIYNRLLSMEEAASPFKKPARPKTAKRSIKAKLAAKRAQGVPEMRKRAEAWCPSLRHGTEVKCVKGQEEVTLENRAMKATLSLDTGEITSLTAQGEGLLSAPAGVAIRDIASGVEFAQQQGSVEEVRIDDNATDSASVTFEKRYEGAYTAAITYTLNAKALCCDVQLFAANPEAGESHIDFNLPALSEMTNVFWTREDAPFTLADPPAELAVYRQYNPNTIMVLPAMTVYNPQRDAGLSVVAPFDLPKPELLFHLERAEGRLRVSNARLRLAKDEPARAAIHIIPHEGCWRPALAWMLEAYPEYLRPGTEGAIKTPGCYWLGGPGEDRPTLEALREQGCTWFQIHSHFPFYGLYMPDTESWEVIVGLADQGTASFPDWEAGKDQGGFKNSYDHMRKAIALRQECGLQPLLYFQSFELWKPYAAKHFADDIARNRSGAPHGAWAGCSLMNPDPAFAWGKHIAAQIKRVPEEYPGLDGIFYDRDDYRQYDYAHDDGVSMAGTTPCYPLCFAQEQINEVVTGVLRQHQMGIITNGPTSVEVCKHIDGIMAETNGWASCLQYLGLARTIVLLPFFFDTNSYDNTPQHTEDKLKMALRMGAFPSLTYGDEACKELDAAYRPLFDLLKDREWVLNAHALELPEGMQGNIFRSPKGYYMAAVVDFNKSQVAGDQPTLGVDLAVNVPDAAAIKHGYLLAGDREGVEPLDFSREDTTLRVTIPSHLAASMVVFSRKPLFDNAGAPEGTG